MTAGVPGTGIGGLFYLAAAAWLPVRAALRRLGGAPVTWRSALVPAGLALGILAGIWITGWLFALMLGPVARLPMLPGHGLEATRGFENVMRWAALVGASATLTAVLLAVHLARLLVTPRRPAIRWIAPAAALRRP